MLQNMLSQHTPMLPYMFPLKAKMLICNMKSEENSVILLKSKYQIRATINF